MQKKIVDIIASAQKAQKPFLSFEFFPPKNEEAMTMFHEVAQQLTTTNPSFVTVTYGAGGSTRKRTLEMCHWLKENFNMTVMPHLTCVGASKEEIKRIAQKIHADGFKNIMVLRGDPPKGSPEFKATPNGFHHANELVTFLKSEYPDFCLGVAGYPEKHLEAPTMKDDLLNLKRKVDCGAAFITTQLFFDNTHYYRFVEQARKIGIGEAVPIIPGIMPILSYSQIKRLTSMCGVTLPPKLVRKLEKEDNDHEAMEIIGIDWATKQINYLMEAGVPGIHLYVLNRSRAALELSKRLQF